MNLNTGVMQALEVEKNLCVGSTLLTKRKDREPWKQTNLWVGSTLLPSKSQRARDDFVPSLFGVRKDLCA